jgi:REP element-mobilizing transposase RayT
MSRKLRIEYPGAMYHIMNRGDQREDIFRDDEDRQRRGQTVDSLCRYAGLNRIGMFFYR